MSYDELDAWIEQKARDGWPPGEWSLCSLALRPDVEYGGLEYKLPSHLRGLLAKVSGWGRPRMPSDRLAILLAKADLVVEAAQEQAEDEARSCWQDQETWYSVVDTGISGQDEPATVLIQCMDYVGPPEGATYREMCAAMALWSFGELAYYFRSDDSASMAWALGQAAIAVAEHEFLRAIDERLQGTKLSRLQRSKLANDSLHKANRRRKKEAYSFYVAMWADKDFWGAKAKAAGAISKEFSLSAGRAKQWVSEFAAAHQESQLHRLS